MTAKLQTILCEKPSQAADWAKFFNFLPSHKKRNHYIDTTRGIAIVHGVGHLFELAPPEYYVPELAKSWSLQYLPVCPAEFKVQLKPELKPVFDTIKSVLSKTSELLIATDADNEGELIARDIIEHSGYKGVVKRVLYSSTVKKSLQKAYDNPVPEKTTRRMAAEASLRRRLDWLVGMNGTMALSSVLRNNGSLPKGHFPVGRVITAISLIVYFNDMARRQFVEKTFYTLKAKLRTKTGGQFTATLQYPDKFLDPTIGRCTSLKVAQAFSDALKGKSVQVAQISSEEKSKVAPLPHDLSSLQSALDKHGIDADEGLALLQGLYDTPVSAVTYPRTECRYLPEAMLDDVKLIVNHLNDLREIKKLDLDLAKKPASFNDKKVEVHHGIIPTTKSVNLSKLTEKQICVYLTIALRFVAQFMPDYRYLSQKVTLTAGDFSLAASSVKVLSEGWRQAERMLMLSGTPDSDDDVDGEDGADQGIDVTEGEVVQVVDVEIVTSKTQKPSAFTTAKLIDEMKRPGRWSTNQDLAKVLNDSDGIGTPATRSDVIKRALQKGLIVKKGRYLAPSKFFEDHAVRLKSMDPGFTALMQREIKAGIESTESEEKTIKQFQKYLIKVIAEWQRASVKA